MVEAIAIGVFVFVAVYVGGSRIMRRLDEHKAAKEGLRRLSVTNRAKRGEYTGGYFNIHGNRIDQ